MENGTTQGEGKDPSGFLSDIIGNSVTVKLNSGVVYKGEQNAAGQPDCSVLISMFVQASCSQSTVT